MIRRQKLVNPSTPRRWDQRRCRARTSLVLGLVFFLSVQLGSATLQDCWRPELRDPEYGQKLHILREQLAAEPDRPLVLVLGSSRTEVGLRPNLIPLPASAGGRAPLLFNFGLPGGAPLQELVCLHRVLSEGIRPAWVLVEVLPPALHDDRHQEEWLRPDRLAWSDLRLMRRYCPQPGDLYWDYCSTHLVPWFSYRFCFMSRYAPCWLPWKDRQDYIWNNIDSAGWVGCLFDTGDRAAHRRRVEEVRREYESYFGRFHISPVTDQPLRKLLHLCRREGIQVALFTMPEASEFRSWYYPEMEKEVDGYLAGLTREFHVPLIDTRTWVPDEGFYDAHHLLACGARTFSERFGREVLRPLLDGKVVACYP
jgi:hypothetical protein